MPAFITSMPNNTLQTLPLIPAEAVEHHDDELMVRIPPRGIEPSSKAGTQVSEGGYSSPGASQPVDLPSPRSIGDSVSSATVNEAFDESPTSKADGVFVLDPAGTPVSREGPVIYTPSSASISTVGSPNEYLDSISEENHGRWLAAFAAGGYTQSDIEIASPNTTVTTLTSMQAASVPHVQNVSFCPTPEIVQTAPSCENCSVCLAGKGLDPSMLHVNTEGQTVSWYLCASHGGSSMGDGGDSVSMAHCGTADEAVEQGKRKRSRNNRCDRESHSERKYHEEKRSQYGKTRHRHLTDPKDFEGILGIIGGFSYWQLGVYALICLQQIPHAMFNLSIIFFMFTPEHHCNVSELQTHAATTRNNWTREARVQFSIPTSGEKGLANCERYDRDYKKYSAMTATEALAQARSAGATNQTTTCGGWEYDGSIMNSTIVTEWNLVCSKSMYRAHAHLAYAVGYLAGCAVSGLSSDRFGRKPTIIGFGMLASLLGLILPYSTYFPVFLFVRFLSAVCNEAADLAAYVLCLEITATKYRAAVGSLVQAPWALGYVALVGVAYCVRDWKTIQIITAALHTMSIFLICVLPESPRWLVVNDRMREAELIIRRACRINGRTLPPDLELVVHQEHRKWVRESERATVFHIFRSRLLTIRTILLFVIWASTCLVYYGIALSLSNNSGMDLFLNNAMAGGIEFPVLAVCVVLLSFGRRRSLMLCLILSGAMVLTVVLLHNESKWLRLAFMLLAKAAAQAAFNILYIFSSELYPTVIRNSVIGLASMVARLGSGISGYVAILSDVTDARAPMIIFGVFSFLAGALVTFFPETMESPLPDTLLDAAEIVHKTSRSHNLEPTGLIINDSVEEDWNASQGPTQQL